jgi:hypothetical protein
MLFGSTQQHYTASKTFQCLLSKKPLFCMLHAQSSAVSVIKESKADQFLYQYNDGDMKNKIIMLLKPILVDFQTSVKWNINLDSLDKYTSKQSARILADAIDKVLLINDSR